MGIRAPQSAATALALGLLCMLSAAARAAEGDAAPAAAAPRVAIVTDTGSTDRLTNDCFRRVRDALAAEAIPAVVVPERDILADGLRGFDVAVFPYSPAIGHGPQAAVRLFCREGGRVILFSRAFGLEQELGLASVRYVGGTDAMPFRRVAFDRRQLPGLPAELSQNSWGITRPDPVAGTKVLGHWLDPAGKESPYVAATLSEKGMYFSHVPLTRDAENQAALGKLLHAAIDYLAPRAVRAPRPPVAVVYGTAMERARASDASLLRDLNSAAYRMLDRYGVPYAVLGDEAVAAGALAGFRVAIFPDNTRSAAGEAEAFERFTRDGGKLIGFWLMDRRVLPLMGVASARFLQGDPANPFLTAKFRDDAPDGFPASMVETSQNLAVTTTSPDGRVLADWLDSRGKATGHPAVTLGPHGIHYSYILRAQDMENSPRFLLAALVHLAGDDICAAAAPRLHGRLWDFRRFTTSEELGRACRRNPAAATAFAEAVRRESAAAAALRAGRVREAVDGLLAARELAEDAFIRCLPTRTRPEFRGAWLHSPDVPDGDWDVFFRAMKDAHLNALLPNVCNASSADYESDLLPTSDLVKSNGPRMEPMFAAARRHGIELHLWRVNLRLGRVGADAVAKLKAANRICLDPSGEVVGGPNSGTLCPSHPENQALEVAAMIEMARKFRPDGIHFDYIRYPNGQACYCPGCRARFEARIGEKVRDWPKDVLAGGVRYADYRQFRRDQITAIVRETSRRMRAEHPRVKLSAAVFSNWETAREGVGQDWAAWAREGLLDFVCTMTYTPHVEAMGRLAAKQRGWTGGRIPLYVGLGAYRAAGAWHLADLTDTAFGMGADGVVYFQIRGKTSVDAILRQAEGPLRAPAPTPRAARRNDR